MTTRGDLARRHAMTTTELRKFEMRNGRLPTEPREYPPISPKAHIPCTRVLTLAERGAYYDLLFFNWHNGPLPNELPKLALLLGVSIDECRALWPSIESLFELTDRGWVNRRLDERDR